MVSPALNPQACWQFEGEILVLHHPTTILSSYQAMGKKLFLYLVVICNLRIEKIICRFKYILYISVYLF